MSESDRESFYEFQTHLFSDFSFCGDWLNGVAPTKEEVKIDTIYLLGN